MTLSILIRYVYHIFKDTHSPSPYKHQDIKLNV